MDCSNLPEKKTIPSLVMDLLNTPKKKKIPSSSKKKNNDLSQLYALYALEKEKQAKLSPLSNKMVLSIETKLFKHDKRSNKRVVHVLPPETTNDLIVSIDPTVDLVDSLCNDQSKLQKKKKQ